MWADYMQTLSFLIQKVSLRRFLASTEGPRSIPSSQNNLAPEQSQLPCLSAAAISVASLQPTEAEPAKVTSPGKVRIELTQLPIWIP